MKDVKKIKGLYAIIQHDHYIVLYGKKLIICNDDGEVIACRNELRNVRKVIAVSSNEILVDCGPQKAYVALSLADGSELWRVPHPRLDYTSRNFTISKDHASVYDYYDLRGNYFLVQIDLSTKMLKTVQIETGLRCISDIACDPNGGLCLLEHHYEIIGNKHISTNGIRCVYDAFNSTTSSYYWKYMWSFDFPAMSLFFFGDTDTVLTKDLVVYCPKTGAAHDLITKEDMSKIPIASPFDVIITPDKRHIVLAYDDMNVVIEIQTATVVAKYKTDFYHGCLVNNQFWVSSKDGVLIKPFPLMEDIPQKSYDFWGPWSAKQE